MFVPIVPHTSHTTVINKTIVYSDTVLSLKDLGSNLMITTITNIDEKELEECLKIIFESNQNVVFNTIQYSKSEKKLYFYADSEVSKKEYEESKINRYKPLTSAPEILEEIKRVLLAEKCKRNDCISLFDLSNYLKQLDYDYKMFKNRYEDLFDNIIKLVFGENSSIIIYDFDYKNKRIRIGFKKWRNGDYEEIWFAKDNGDLYIAESKCYYDKQLLVTLCSELSELYDEFMKYSDYKDYRKVKFNSTAANSNFLVDVSCHGVKIFTKSKDNPFLDSFKLFSASYNDDFDLECNSSLVIEALKDKEKDIFKRIFIRIEDCPEWSQNALRNIRKNQLEEERIKDEKLLKEKEQEESKKQKVKSIKRRFLPFLFKKDE